MRLDFFMLAESAAAIEGKLYIHGGALSYVAPPHFPWVHPQLSMVLRVEFDDGDEDRDHNLAILMRSPDGEDVVPTIELPIIATSLPPRVPGRPIFLNAALTVGTLPLREPGTYVVEVYMDGDIVHQERLHVGDENTSEFPAVSQPPD